MIDSYNYYNLISHILSVNLPVVEGVGRVEVEIVITGDDVACCIREENSSDTCKVETLGLLKCVVSV